MLYRTSTAIVVLVLALCAWGLVGFFAWKISADAGEYVAHAKDAQREATLEASAARTHALALDAAEESAQLKGLLDVDVVSSAYLIESVGQTAGVTVQLGDAQPENATASDEGAVKVVGFFVQADGKFSALMNAAQLFETLPIPSTVTRLDIERAPVSSGSSSGTWHMNLYIRILTTSDISS